jgi:hypothetical protein
LITASENVMVRYYFVDRLWMVFCHELRRESLIGD